MTAALLPSFDACGTRAIRLPDQPLSQSFGAACLQIYLALAKVLLHPSTENDLRPFRASSAGGEA